MQVNSGTYRFPITLYYLNSSSVDDMGSYVPTFTSYSVTADITPVSDAQRVKLGMNIEETAYRVTCRVPVSTGRPVKLDYDSVEYRVTACTFSRLKDRMEMITVKVQ